MCGLAGVVARDAVPGSDIDAMLDRQAHRGPDGRGRVGFAGRELRPDIDGATAAVHLGHLRLAILDLSPAGAQPMASADGRWWIAYNGEVYNYVELREELRALGCSFRTGTDTEVVMAAWATWGAACLPRLQGMFAFALLDRQARRVHLVRDFAGIKPLFWMAHRGGVWFASEIKGLLAVPGFVARADAQAVHDYLAWGLHDGGERTCFAGISRLPAGSHAEIALDQPHMVEPRRWWQPYTGPARSVTLDQAAEELRTAFLATVRQHLRSDVPVGAALSGGIDSSAVVMAIRHLDPKADIRTFSFVAGDADVDEERWATLVAERARATRHLIRVEADMLRTDLDRLIITQDEPFGSTSIYAQHQVFRRAREHGVTVMLDGQGADELLGGYRVHQPARIATLVGRGRWIAAWRQARALRALPGGGRSVAGRVAVRFLPRPVTAWLARRVGMAPDLPAVARAWFADHGAEIGKPIRPGGGDRLRAELAEAFSGSMLPGLLRYEDRNSMAHSVESRVPFLTPDLARIIQGLPEALLIDDAATSKAVFRRAMRGIVPDEILDRRDKIGFATPEGRWLRELAPWVEETLVEAQRLPFAAPADAASRWQAVRDGSRPKDEVLWRWLNLARWGALFRVTW